MKKKSKKFFYNSYGYTCGDYILGVSIYTFYGNYYVFMCIYSNELLFMCIHNNASLFMLKTRKRD